MSNLPGIGAQDQRRTILSPSQWRSKQSHYQTENPHFEGLVENEFFCMRLAAAAGLQAANVEIGMAGSIRFLQVDRYDRRALPDGRLKHIHQEDFCQALGIVPELKYQQEGGPNLKQCFELVRSISSIPGPDLLRLFDAAVFNFLIGNCDAHGKNFSFLREEKLIRLAPLYDLASTQVNPHLSAQMAMKIGGERARKSGRAKLAKFYQRGSHRTCRCSEASTSHGGPAYSNSRRSAEARLQGSIQGSPHHPPESSATELAPLGKVMISRRGHGPK